MIQFFRVILWLIFFVSLFILCGLINMHHSFLDIYSDKDSPIHKIDPRIKILISILLIIFAVTTNNLLEFIVLSLILLISIYFSNISIKNIFIRSLKIIPFILILSIFIPFMKGGSTLIQFKFIIPITIQKEGLILFSKIVLRSYFVVLITIILITTTRFTSLLKGFEGLKFPHVFILILSFMYRYIFLFFDEFERLLRARNSRMIKPGMFLKIKSLAYVIGTMFLRTFERSERVYEAMISRGFTGEIITMEQMSVKKLDIIILSFVFLILLIMRLISVL